MVTTTRITHATPAATYSHVCHRDAENTIAARWCPAAPAQRQAERRHRRILRRRHGLLPAQENGGKRNDKRNLIDEIKTRYGYAANRADFDALPTDGRKIAGLFTKSHMAYDLDRDPAKEPSLADMTGKAIDALAARNKGSS